MTGSEPVAPDLTLRPARADEAVVLADLEVRVRAGTPGLPPPAGGTEAVVDRVRRAVAATDREVWVATTAADDVVGQTVTTPTWLEDLYVDPAHQRRGVGSALLGLVCGSHPHGFGLWVHADNAGARAFYRAHGLVELESTDGSASDEGVPDVRVVWPGERPLAFLRRAIDEVDDELAELLARRTALTAAVQDHKESSGAGGRRGRDAEREAEIVARMSAHAPGLDPVRLARVMDTVIRESLETWELRRGRPPGER